MDFGIESPEIVKLFKSDYGHEPEIWEKLEKATLTETIAARQGTSPTTTPSVSAPEKPTTPTPTTPNVGGLANRLRTAQVTQEHPAVQQATDRLNKQGIQVIDKMPSHYTPDMRAKAMNNVAKGVEFMHKQFPGMQRLHQRFGMKYKLQGPQMLGTGQLMGQYHPPESSQNPGVYPQIELNGTAEHTLWHEHAHFLDHASTGNLFGRGRGTNTPGHALHDFAKELQNHPVRQMAQKHEIAAAVHSGQQNLINHAMYRNQEDEVFARWFNSHMNYLHGREGEDPTSEPYDAQYNEGWTPEHHEYFGGKLRDILKQHKMTRSFGEYLDKLHKAIRVQKTSETSVEGRTLKTRLSPTAVPVHYAKPTIQQTPQPPARVHGVPALSRPVNAPDLKPYLEHMVINSSPRKFKNPEDTTSPTLAANIQKQGSRLHSRRIERALAPHMKPGHTPQIIGSGVEAMAVDLGDKVARITSSREPDRPPHPWMLQPVEKGSSGFLHYEVVPKVGLVNQAIYHEGRMEGRPPNAYARRVKQHIEDLRQQAKVHGYIFQDDHEGNIGYQNGNPVIIDPGAVHPEDDWSNYMDDLKRRFGKSFSEYLDDLTKALEDTRQGRPLPGTQRATRMPQGYKVPRKITRPGVRGSTLWWYDERGNVRYGPKPVQKGPPKDEPQHVKDYLQSERPWSFMSAYSESRPTDQNDQLHAQLGKELQANPDHEVYPSRGYYTDEQGQLREEPSYLVIGMTTKSALPIGQKYGQNTVLTHHGMFDVNQRTLAPIRYKRVEYYDLPKDIPQTVVLTQPNHVTIVIDTGQPVPFGPSRA